MPETLDTYVRRVLRIKGLTLGEVAARSGGEISRAYICDISRGQTLSLTVRKLQALARGLDVPEEEIFAVARGAIRDNREFADSRFALLAARYRELPHEDQREIAILLDAVAREIERRRAHNAIRQPSDWAATAARRIEALFAAEARAI